MFRARPQYPEDHHAAGGGLKHGLIILLILCMVACQSSESRQVQPKAISGAIDLSDWEPNADGSLRLEGDWGFEWQNFVPLKIS